MSDLSSRQVRWFVLLVALVLIPVTYLLSASGKVQVNAEAEEIVSDGSRHEPFCTVWEEPVSEPSWCLKRVVRPPNQTARPTLLKQGRPRHGLRGDPVVFIRLQSATSCVRRNGTL
jgi:hypothetical protein